MSTIWMDEKSTTSLIDRRGIAFSDKRGNSWVNPISIDQSIFQEERSDKEQERTRRIILEAFKELKANPEKYARMFKVIEPEKIWKMKRVRELKQLANALGDHMTDWVEQALEWAQRIANGETWEETCNLPDSTKWCRLITCKNGKSKVVGGAREAHIDWAPSHVFVVEFSYNDFVQNVVPSIVSYE